MYLTTAQLQVLKTYINSAPARASSGAKVLGNLPLTTIGTTRHEQGSVTATGFTKTRPGA